MSWFLWIVGWILFLFGVLGVLTAPLIYQAFVAPVIVIGALWIGFGGVIESVNRVRVALVKLERSG